MSYWMLNCYKNVFKMFDIQKKVPAELFDLICEYLLVYIHM